ncbi:hypothetical protein Dimus_001292, partial [Dionaea muscipula]
MEGQTRKRHQKQMVRTGPAAKRAKTDKGEVTPVGSRAEQRDESVVNASPTAEELDQQVDDLLARPFVSEALQEGDIEKNSSGKLLIPMGSDGGMSLILRNEGVVEVEENEEADGQDEDEGETSKGGVGERPSARRIHQGFLSKCRLRKPNQKMMRGYEDVLLGSTTRGARMGLDQLSQKHKLALIVRNITE